MQHSKLQAPVQQDIFLDKTGAGAVLGGFSQEEGRGSPPCWVLKDLELGIQVAHQG